MQHFTKITYLCIINFNSLPSFKSLLYSDILCLYWRGVLSDTFTNGATEKETPALTHYLFVTCNNSCQIWSAASHSSVKHLLYHASDNKNTVTVFYMKESRAMLFLQTKSPNEPKWRHPWSHPPHNFHPIYFYSFTQSLCQCSSHLNASIRLKQINTFPTYLRERNVCLLCTEFFTPAELRCRKPVWDTSDLNIKSDIISGVRLREELFTLLFFFLEYCELWSSAVQSLCANNTPHLMNTKKNDITQLKPGHAEKMEQK